MSIASKWLNLSDHFWSSFSILLSVADLLSTVFLDLDVEGWSFLDFFSGETVVGEGGGGGGGNSSRITNSPNNRDSGWVH